jgi:hypothetical protein
VIYSSQTQRRGGTAARAAYLAAAGLACLLLAACNGSAARGDTGPLMPDSTPGNFISCLEAPDPGTAIVSWRTPIGFALDMYFNRSGRTLTVESVRLADAHGLVMHRALVYLMSRDENPLPYERPWSQIGQGVPEPAWAHGHQSVPGAVIKPVHGKAAPGEGAGNVYQVVLDVSAASPEGGWATGEIIRYRAGARTYSVRSYTGYAIAPPTGKLSCRSQTKTIRAVFKTDALPG